MANVPQISTTITRSGFIIDIEGTGASVTYYPYDKDKTYDAIIAKCKELGQDLTVDVQNSEVKTELHNIDIQLTEIYKQYYEQVANRIIKEEDQLLIIANSLIKHKFQDQTGKFYVVIEKDSHDEIIDIDYQEFDSFLAKMYFETEKKMISKDKRNNVKTLIKAYITERRILYNRVARIGDAIYYDLNNAQRQCVKITKDRWEIVENPLLFRPKDSNFAQVTPDRDYDRSRHYIREIVDKSTIKHEHQKLIDEVYTISLFIPDIAHPMDVPIGPKGSGKTMHLKVKKLIVDPRKSFDELVEKLPRDERDRRVAIYDNCISYFDNESMLTYDEMDELCMWVTGFSKTIRILNTTDERRTYSGKRPIGINGINIPVSNSDILSRCFINEHLLIPDGRDGKDSKIERETKFLDHIKEMVPQMLGYIFDVLVKVLQRFDEVDEGVKSSHRLADFIIWGETISRVLGYDKNEFLNRFYVKMVCNTVYCSTFGFLYRSGLCVLNN